MGFLMYSRMELDGIDLFDPEYDDFEMKEGDDVGSHHEQVGAEAKEVTKRSVFDRLGPSPPKASSPKRKRTRWDVPALSTPTPLPQDRRRVSRWDISPEGSSAAAVVPVTPVRVVHPVGLGCPEPLRHWSAVRLPYQLTALVTKRVREGGDRVRMEHMLKKVLYADQKCGSSTPICVLQAMIQHL